MSDQPPKSPKSVRSFVSGYTSELGDRIKAVIVQIGGLQEAAKIAGVTDEQVARWRDGISKPPFFAISSLCQHAGISLSWLATGDGLKTSDPQFPDPDFSGVPQMFRQGDDFAMVPRLEVQASAGPGALVEHEDAIDFMAFQAAWLRRKGIDPTAARALTVRGDSMEPTIRSGDVLLVDTSKRRVEDNGIYVVVSGGYVLVKRVHPRRDGSMMLISDNQAYPPEDVPSHEAADFSVAGRVMWFGRSI